MVAPMELDPKMEAEWPRLETGLGATYKYHFRSKQTGSTSVKLTPELGEITFFYRETKTYTMRGSNYSGIAQRHPKPTKLRGGVRH